MTVTYTSPSTFCWWMEASKTGILRMQRVAMVFQVLYSTPSTYAHVDKLLGRILENGKFLHTIYWIAVLLENFCIDIRKLYLYAFLPFLL